MAKANVKKSVKKADKTDKTEKTDKKISSVPEKSTVKPDVKATKPDVVAKGHLISVEYTGTLDSGEIFDESKNNGPIKFIVGSHQVIKGFDEAVVGMKIDEKKKFNIRKEDAYGDINPQMMHKVPIEKLPPDIKTQAKVGGFLVLQSPTGQQIPAKIAAMDKDNITLDLNHPLAGKELTFDIRIVSIESVPDNQMHHDHNHANDHHNNHDHNHLHEHE